IVTAAWLKLVPAPELQLPVVGFYADAAAGCEALATVLASGLQAAAIEYVDALAAGASLGAFPGAAPPGPAFMLIAEADGSQSEARRLRAELLEALEPGALATHAPLERAQIRDLWRWRAGVPLAAIAERGGKVSEDIVVPTERLAEAIAATVEIGARHGLPACSWGHAGDGNIHATLLIDSEDPSQLERAEAAGQDLFALAASLGGSVSGEHGLGLVKRGALARQWPERALALHEQIKQLFDPKGLLNPGKKLARPCQDPAQRGATSEP
ncbi:MAG: FAD-binding oxidoreductase, partial [Solirubrobacteraceae bacterium]